jgi:hypothetical protein
MFGNKVNVNQTSEFAGPKGEVNCKTAAGGTLENIEGGVGSLSAVAFYDCKGPQCEDQILKQTGLEGREFVEAVNMPASINGHPERRFVGWSMRLVETEIAGVLSVRLKIGEPFVKFQTPTPPAMIRVREGCEIAASETLGGSPAVFEGELDPEIGIANSGNLNGTSASKPSTARFSGASTGALHAEIPTTSDEATYTNSLKYLGYNEQELITVKP